MSVIPRTKLMLVLVAFVAYAYYQDSANKKKFQQPVLKNDTTEVAKIAATEEAPKVDEPKTVTGSLTKSVIDKISENETGKVVVDALIKHSMEKKYGQNKLGIIVAGQGSVNVIDTLKGTGNILNCGAKAVINYDAYNSHSIKFDSTTIKDEKKPLVISVGAGQVIKGLEAGIVGMSEGGSRKISIPASLAFDAPGFTNNLVGKGDVVEYDVTLEKINDGPYKTNSQVKTVNEVTGSGSKILCGDTVKVKYAFIDASGAPISNEAGEVEFAAGSGDAPIGFEFAAIGTNKGTKKIIEIPSDLLKSAGKSKLPDSIKFKEGDSRKVELEFVTDKEVVVPTQTETTAPDKPAAVQ